MFTDKLVR